MKILRVCEVGDDRLEQKGREPRYDILRWRPFCGEIEVAAIAKRADNSATGA